MLRICTWSGEVSVRELRNSTASVIEDLGKGDHLTLTVNRRPVAAVADTSVFIAQETGRDLDDLPTELAVSVITAAEPELGVLGATDRQTRATRLAMLSRVQATCRLLPVDPQVASCFARIAASERDRGRRPRRHDTWVAATAMRHGASVVTQDADFSAFEEIDVLRV
jgi:predicted nucleic acid-binding protein